MCRMRSLMANVDAMKSSGNRRTKLSKYSENK